MEAKGLFTSKTIWFNLVIAALTALWPILGPLTGLSGEQAAGLAAAGNVMLRIVTTQPVKVA